MTVWVMRIKRVRILSLPAIIVTLVYLLNLGDTSEFPPRNDSQIWDWQLIASACCSLRLVLDVQGLLLLSSRADHLFRRVWVLAGGPLVARVQRVCSFRMQFSLSINITTHVCFLPYG